VPPSVIKEHGSKIHLTAISCRCIIWFMPERSRKKSTDLNQLAKSVVDEATTEEVLVKAIAEGKNPAAVILGRLGGLKGGKARAAKLSAAQRKEIAKKAATTRWEAKSND